MSSDKKFYEETWFELAFAAGCAFTGYLLFHHLMPPVRMTDETVQAVAMARLFSEGRFMDAFLRYNQPPVYPLILSLLVHFKHTMELPRLIASFQQLNFGLYLASGGLVYAFIRRQIRKPYIFAITGLYLVAPTTLQLAWRIGPEMTYMVLSSLALLIIDYSLSRESAEGGNISRGELLTIGLVLCGSILTQQLGYTLLLAFFFIMLKRLGLKKSALILSIMLACMSPFIGRDIFTVIRKPDPYIESSATIISTVGRRGIFRTVEAYADNFVRSITHNAVGHLNLTSLERPAQPSAGRTIGLEELPWGRWLLGLLAIIGTLYGLYQFTGVGSLYLSAYLITALIIMPGSQLSLAPVLPLILFYLYFGVMRAGEWMNRLHLPVSKFAGPLLTAWILLCTVSTHILQNGADVSFQSNMQNGAPASAEPKVIYMSTAREPETRLEEAQSKSAHRRAMDWLKANSPEDARVAAPRPEAASLLVRQDGKPESDSQRAMRKALSRYDFLWEEAGGKIAPLKTGADARRGMKLVYEDPPGGIRIWQIQPTMH